MLTALSKDRYRDVLTLLEVSHPNYFDVVARAVIARNSPGSIWVDDRARPRSALLRDRGSCYYLMGDAGNTAFNAELQQLLAEQLSPAALARGAGIFKLYCSPSYWESRVEAIFSTATLTKRERTLFRLDRPALPDWRARLAAPATVTPIDAGLLASADLGNLQHVVSEILSTWDSLDRFLRAGFGYCLLVEGQIVCWCTAEYVEAKNTGVGIETVEQHWNRGYATLTAAAFVEHCAKCDLTAHWDAWKSNLPSHVVAEKVGFNKILDYDIYQGEFTAATAGVRRG